MGLLRLSIQRASTVDLQTVEACRPARKTQVERASGEEEENPQKANTGQQAENGRDAQVNEQAATSHNSREENMAVEQDTDDFAWY